jgi:hypothetical protein
VIGAEAVATIGIHGSYRRSLIIRAYGPYVRIFGKLLRLWRIAPIPAAAVISALSLLAMPAFWAMVVSIT